MWSILLDKDAVKEWQQRKRGKKEGKKNEVQTTISAAQ